MSIASRIEAIEQHLTDDYNVLEVAGADLTNVNKNILNLKATWQERLLYFINNGTDVVWNNWDKVTGEGTILTLNSTEEAPMKINLKGNTSQEGTPTPETPQPIHVVSGDNSIEVGNNVFDISTITPNSFIDNNGNIYASSASNLSDYIEVKENDIILSYDYTSLVSTSTRAYCWFDSNKNFISGHLYSPVNKTNTFSVVSGAKYIRFTYDKNISNIKVSNQSASYPISLGDIELCEIGDYQDSIVKDNGKWYLNKQIGKVVLNGSEGTWGMYNVTQGNLFRNMDILRNVELGKLCYANYYRGIEVTASNFSTIRQNGDIYINPSNPYIDIVDNTQSSVSNFVSWLGTHNLILYYAMTTPTYTEITDSTLLSQLNDLWENAISYKAQTNITQTNNDLPFIISATALKEMS